MSADDKSGELTVGMLKNLGLRVEGEKVFFPTLRSPVGKKHKNDYSRKTFDKAIRYLVENEAKVPYNTAGALSAIHDTLRKSDQFESLVKQYPNIKLLLPTSRVCPLLKIC